MKTPKGQNAKGGFGNLFVGSQRELASVWQIARASLIANINKSFGAFGCLAFFFPSLSSADGGRSDAGSAPFGRVEWVDAVVGGGWAARRGRRPSGYFLPASPLGAAGLAASGAPASATTFWNFDMSPLAHSYGYAPIV